MNSKEDPARVILFGMYGAVNVGDELICRAVVQGLKRQFPDVRPVIATSKLARSNAFNRIREAIYVEGGSFHYSFWLNLPKYLAAVRKADAIVIGGGGLFQDHYSWRLSSSAAFCALTGKLLGKPVFVIGVGAGPLKRPEVRQAVAASLQSADLVCVRDQQSKDVLIDCGISEDHVRVTADVVPSMVPSLEGSVNHAPENRIAFALRKWPGIDKTAFSQLLEDLVERGYEVDLLCFEPSGDEAFYRSVICRNEPGTLKHITINQPRTLEDALIAVEKASCVISMRYHGLILAMMHGKPVVPVEYEKKVANLTRELGLGDLLKQTHDIGADLKADIEAIRSGWNTRQDLLRKRWSAVVESSESNFVELKAGWSRYLSNTNTASRLGRYADPWCRILIYALRREAEHLISRSIDIISQGQRAQQNRA